MSAPFWAPGFWGPSFWAPGFWGNTSPAPPGGTFRRSLPTWRRTVARWPTTWPRTAARSLPTLARVWRYRPMPSLPTEGETLISAVSDDREYAFDLQHAPELRDPAVSIVSGAISGGAGLTIVAPAVLDEAFDSIPAGKGCKVRISGGVAGTTYKFALTATLSNGRKVVVPARLTKVADYGT